MSTIQTRVATLAAAIALVAVSACSDKSARPATDSSLARDLALAGAQTQAPPTFQDTAVAPAPTPASRAKQAPPAPVKARAAEKPVTRTPRPVQVAQQSAPTPTTPAPVPAPAAAAPVPAPAPAQIGAGTGFALTSGSKVCSSALPGEKFVATVNSAVTGSNGAVIPAGSQVVLEVAGNNGSNTDGQLNLRVKAIVVGDKTYSVTGDVVPEATLVRTKIDNPDQNADKKKVIGGAIVGGLLGQMIGHNTKGTIIGAATGAAAGAVVAKQGEKYESCLPSGSAIRMTLNSPVTMS